MKDPVALQFTETAQEMARRILTQVREEEGSRADKLAIRIFAAPGCSCSVSYGMALDEPSADDTVLELDGFKVIYAEYLDSLLEEAVVDYIDDGLSEGFLIRSPQQGAGGCGCGHHHHE